MLNCTDLACVLHHHHFYAHLHHLKHHLQDDNDNTVLADGTDLRNDGSIQSFANNTNASNDIIYMVCGVLIAMLLVAIIIVLVAITINKLRKRDEAVNPFGIEAQLAIPAQVITEGTHVPIAYKQNPSSVWIFPPQPPQPNIYYSSDHDTLNNINDKTNFKNFRKQFSGRFKRLVAKKPIEPAPAIPPELRPQLKSIYVY